MTVPRRGSLRERLSREEWNLAVVDQCVDDIVQRGIIGPVRWLPKQQRWRGLADPHGYMVDGRLLLFVEQLNWLTGRGELLAATLPPGADPTTAAFTPWLRSASHLSYPFLFNADGELCCTMEAAETGALYLCQYRDGTWRQCKIMNRPAVDPTLWHDATGWWLFCTFADDEPDQNLHLFGATRPDGPWSPHPGNPVIRDRASARPAGPLFWSAGRLIRPSQDSSETYGGAVVLNEIIQLNGRQFCERPVRRLMPSGAYPHGLHTLCPAGTVTIIDGKRWSLRPLDVPRYVIAGLHRWWRRRRSDAARGKLCFAVDTSIAYGKVLMAENHN